MARSCSKPPGGDFQHRGQHLGGRHIRIRHIREIREIRDEPPRVFCYVHNYRDVRNYIRNRVCVLRRRCLERRHSTRCLFQRLESEKLFRSAADVAFGGTLRIIVAVSVSVSLDDWVFVRISCFRYVETEKVVYYTVKQVWHSYKKMEGKLRIIEVLACGAFTHAIS